MAEGNNFEKTSRLGILIYVLAVVMALFQLYSSAVRTITPILLQNIHIAFAYTLIFLTAIDKAGKRPHPFLVRTIYSTLLVMALGATTYIHFNYDSLIMNVGIAEPTDIFIGILLVIVTLESTRSSFGLPIAVLTVVCIAYMFGGPYFPGILYHGGFSLRRVVSTLTISFGGMYGSLLGVSATFLALFMLFGGILGKSGAGEFFMDLAMGIGGRTKAGPALAAVISSALMGSINGSAVANVATTGTFTIPMMKERGYEPEFAGAVEATASTGGMILPPIMGVGAFIMADLTGISYGRICMAALIPALLYYLLCGAAVIFHSNKLNLKKADVSNIPSVGKTFANGFYYLIPVVVIICYMSWGYSVTKSAIAGISTQIAIIILKTLITHPSNLFCFEGWRPLFDGLVDGVHSVVGVAVTLACVGMMVDCIVATGLAHRLVILVLTLGQNNPLASLLITMLIALFFGMGVPTTASYILLATMAVPALIQAGLPKLPVHLFCYYFTIIGNVTPPVGNAAIVASRMAGANYNKTCYYAILLSLSGFLLPFLFVFRPELLLQGNILSILDVTLTCTLGLLALGAFFERWFLVHTTSLEQIMLFAAAVMLIYPAPLWLSAIGIVILGSVTASQRKKHRIAGL
jgi:TRAP transporter 4TM/12TM fusion protein